MTCEICKKEIDAPHKTTCSPNCFKKRQAILLREYKQARFENNILDLMKDNELSREFLGPMTKNLYLLAENLKHRKERDIREILQEITAIK